MEAGGQPMPDPLQLAGNRDQLTGFLGGLREQGQLSVTDEAAVMREYDVLLAQLRTERSRLEQEFRERLPRDGQQETESWLREAAESLGRRQGEQMRQLLATIPAFANQHTPAGNAG